MIEGATEQILDAHETRAIAWYLNNETDTMDGSSEVWIKNDRIVGVGGMMLVELVDYWTDHDITME